MQSHGTDHSPIAQNITRGGVGRRRWFTHRRVITAICNEWNKWVTPPGIDRGDRSDGIADEPLVEECDDLAARRLRLKEEFVVATFVLAEALGWRGGYR